MKKVGAAYENYRSFEILMDFCRYFGGQGAPSGVPNPLLGVKKRGILRPSALPKPFLKKVEILKEM